jgi:hypothetical protein
MTMTWNDLTPWTAVAGGALIGVVATIFALFNGRVAGIWCAGWPAQAKRRATWGGAWRVGSVLSLIGAPTNHGLFAALPLLKIDARFAALKSNTASSRNGVSSVSVRYQFGISSESARQLQLHKRLNTKGLPAFQYRCRSTKIGFAYSI